MSTEREYPEPTKAEITAEMITAGEEVILGEVGGADLGGYFSARDLARRVYLAMRERETPKPREPVQRRPRAL